MSTGILWFRRDLRLSDQPALRQLCGQVDRWAPLFIWDPAADGDWAPGGASQAWLRRSLHALDQSLRQINPQGGLIIRKGDSLEVLRTVIDETGADLVAWNRQYTPSAIARDRRIKTSLRAQGLEVSSHNGGLLFEPWTIRNQSGQPYKSFSAFWRACLKADPPRPVEPPPRSWPQAARVHSEGIDALELQPKPAWDADFWREWQPGEDAAHSRLTDFINTELRDYKASRDRPDQKGTSGLSPHLHFGEISPHQVWDQVRRAAAHGDVPDGADVASFISEIGWREFAHHLLFHQPDMPEHPIDTRFQAFPWADDDAALRAWRKGETGIPIVDAGMRQLWHIGWMHNRVRMIAGSLLTKNLLLPWQTGERWFWDTLVDADLANNAMGWQWIAGCGADAAPYFRIFNPVLQGERFDPDGDYVRRWVPELAKLPTKHIHAPWQAPADVLNKAAVKLGETYPTPIIDLKGSRQRALDAFAQIKRRRG